MTVAAVVVFSLIGVVSAALDVLFIPFYVGANVFPISVALAIGGNFLVPPMVGRFVRSVPIIALPVGLWVTTSIGLGFANTKDGDVLVPGYGQGQYVAIATLFLGTLAGVVSVLRTGSRVTMAQLRAAERAREFSPATGGSSFSGRR